MQEQRKPVKVSFEGKRTGMGGETVCTLYSLAQRKPLNPAYTDRSKTGNHWTDYYWLFPAKYILAQREISNAGNHHCIVAVILVQNNGGYQILEKLSLSPEKIPDFVSPPCECLVITPQQ